MMMIQQIIATTIDILVPELDLHNLLNTGGIAFLIWFMKRLIDRVDAIDAHMRKQDADIVEMRTEMRIRNEEK